MLDHWLALAGRLPGAEASLVVEAGQVLVGMPTLARLTATGAVSWPLVAALVRELRRVSVEDRAWIDERIGATVTRWEGVEVFDADALVEAVRDARDDCLARGSQRRREVQREQRSCVWAQPRLDA